MRDFVRRVESSTPPDRDRAVDALRAFAIVGVVLGHWLVTALIEDSGTLRGASPLTFMPHLAPVSWVFQTLAVFFLVGGVVGAKGYASARARGTTYREWVGARMIRLFRPVAVVLGVWAVAAVAMLAAGVNERTVRALFKLVWSPLWFLLVFAALTAMTPLVAKLHPLWPLAVVLHIDVIRFGLAGPAWLSSVNVVASWLVPYCLGAAWSRGGLRSRTTRWSLLFGGAVTAAGLILWAGYPASMVGVPGTEISNLDPPNLATVTFGIAQCGAALLLLGPLRRVMQRPAAWAAVAVVNLCALTIFLWHQTAMMMVTALGLPASEALTGLHTVPDGGGWVLARLAWLPAFAVALAVCVAAFHTYERGGPAKTRRSGRIVRGGHPDPAKLARRA
ncbi:acyltransferase [Streptomyces sp. SID5643]|uniref:acyltransferase family protein n=1 Tax=Streptomyces sp. SID5643 TaxID=2690307 RepID=UPI00136A725F|nr:acyltransferase [Streptomyces sp. SID5643]